MKNLGELQSKRGYEEEESNFKVTLQQHMWKNVVVGVRNMKMYSIKSKKSQSTTTLV